MTNTYSGDDSASGGSAESTGEIECGSRQTDDDPRLVSALLRHAAERGRGATAADGTAQEPSEFNLPPGYESRRLLGVGGCGRVVLAYQTALGREVAVKTVHAEAFHQGRPYSRFEREMLLHAPLQHDGIARLYGFGVVPGGDLYLVMEYVKGPTLREHITARGGRLPDRESAELVRHLADAIEYCHGNGVIHRDLKPANVIVHQSGRPKLIDFGLGRVLGRPADAPHDGGCGVAGRSQSTPEGFCVIGTNAGPAGPPDRLTMTGAEVGTLPYMAPEQIGGETGAVGKATDIYGLGVTLFEVLTGRVPFREDGPADTDLRSQILGHAPVFGPEECRRIDRGLRAICLKCLQKSPAERYASAAALADDLARFLRGEVVRADPVPYPVHARKWVRRNRLLTGLLTSTAVAATAIFVWWNEAETSGSLRETNADVEQKRVAERAAAAARDQERARRAAVGLKVAAGTKQLDLHRPYDALVYYAAALARDDSTPPTQLVHRQRIGSLSGQLPQLARVWFLDSPPARLVVSPDGGRVAAITADSDCRVWDVATGIRVGPVLRCRDCVFDSSGRRFAYLGEGVRVVDLDSGRPAGGVVEVEGELRSFAVNREWTRIATASDRRVAVWELETGTPVGPGFTAPESVEALAFSPDSRGRFVIATLAAGPRSSKTLWETVSGRQIPLVGAGEAGPNPKILKLAFSPEGNKIVTLTASPFNDRTGRFHLWDATGFRNQEIRFTPRPDEVASLVLAPDTRRLAVLEAFPVCKVTVIDPSHPINPDRRRTLESDEVTPLNWLTDGIFAPDGRTLIAATVRGDVIAWDVERGNRVLPHLPHHADVVRSAWSPDGRVVATATRDGVVRVWACRPPASAASALQNLRPVVRAIFGPTGRTVLTGDADGWLRVWDLEVRTVRAQVKAHGGIIWDLRLSPDRRRILSAGSDGAARVWDTDSLAPLGPPLTHRSDVDSAEFDPSGTNVLTVSSDPKAGDGRVTLWRLQDAHLLWEYGSTMVVPAHAVLSPDGRAVLVVTRPAGGGGSGWRLSHLDAATGSVRWEVAEEGRQIAAAVWAPNGRTVVTCGSDRLARVRNAATGELRFTLPHDSRVAAATFSPDGGRLFTLADDSGWKGEARCELRGWDPDNGRPFTRPVRLPGPEVGGISCSPDGRLVAAGTGYQGASNYGFVSVWGTDAEAPLANPRPVGAAVGRPEFAPDGTRILWTCGHPEKNTVYVSELPARTGSPEELTAWAELLAGRRLDPGDALVPLTLNEVRERWEQFAPRPN